MINILLVDDHPPIGEGTKHMIEEENDMHATVASTGMQALELLKNQTFDLLLIDLNMPAMNGLELTQRINDLHVDTPILIYTGYDIHPYFNIGVDAGISGYISKTASREQLIMAIRCALRGETIIPITLFKQLRRKVIQVVSEGTQQIFEGVSINETEQAILQQVADGKSNKEVAKILLMSQRNVEYNLTRIFGKLNVSSRAEAIIVAHRLGLIPDKELLS